MGCGRPTLIVCTVAQLVLAPTEKIWRRMEKISRLDQPHDLSPQVSRVQTKNTRYNFEHSGKFRQSPESTEEHTGSLLSSRVLDKKHSGKIVTLGRFAIPGSGC